MEDVMVKKVQIVQDAEKEIPKPVLAQAILDISASARKLSQSGLNHRAIVALIADNSKVAKGTIEVVLNNLEDLAENYCRK